MPDAHKKIKETQVEIDAILQVAQATGRAGKKKAGSDQGKTD